MGDGESGFFCWRLNMAEWLLIYFPPQLIDFEELSVIMQMPF